MKKMVVVMMLLCGVLLFAGNANAAPTWYTCTISAAGNSLGNSFVTATDTGAGAVFSNRIFFLVGSASDINQMLAAGLTAWSTGGKVNIYVDVTTYDGAPCYALSCTN